MSLIFRQLFDKESSTYTYLLASQGEAVFIDTVIENLDRDKALLDQLGLKLKYILDTHIHADHITGAGRLREQTGAKTAISNIAKVDCIDQPLKDGEHLVFGSETLKVIHTPGHTNTCASFLVGDHLFTGDALLIQGCGRTDFQEGSAETLFHSVREKLFKLPDETLVYPGHDYKGRTHSTIGDEKKQNLRLGLDKSLDDFIKTMRELQLDHPKKMDIAVPANLKCGLAK